MTSSIMENVSLLIARRIAALVLSAVFLSSAHAMDMELVHTPDFSKYHIILSGEIKSGDYQKLEDSYLRPIRGAQDILVAFWMTAPIHLDSKGGSVDEALKMAELINKLSRTVIVNGTCASSCSLLFMSGASRVVGQNGHIGLHRIYFNPEYYQNIPISKAKALYEKNEEQFKQRMLKYGLPQNLFERMMRTSSDSIYWLSKSDIESIGMWPPYMEERLIAKCGALPRVMNDYLEKWMECAKASLDDSSDQNLMAFRKSKGLATWSKR